MNCNILKVTPSLNSLINFSMFFLFSVLLTACNNSDTNNKSTITVQEKIQVYSRQTVLKGKVSSENARFTAGKIIVTDDNGKTIETTELGKGNHYSITIPENTELPLILSFYPKNKNNKEALVAVALYPAIKIYDINDLTTSIAKTAKKRGGYTHKNMVFAADNVVGVPDANKTSTGFRGDPTTQYGGWH